MVFSRDGTSCFLAAGDEVLCLSATTGELIYALSGHTGPVTCIALCGSGSQVATGSGDATVKIWDVRDGHLLKVPRRCPVHECWWDLGSHV